MKPESKKILFLAPYPMQEAPSQRFRFEQYFSSFPPHLHYDFQSFWTKNAWEKLYQKGGALNKVLFLLTGFYRRFFILFKVSKYDYLFVHRELTPVGPPIFEYLFIKVFKKKVIYDFDDAIWLENRSGVNRFTANIKFQKKAGWICQWSDKISVGNSFLAAYARQFNSHVLINPTVVDTEKHHNRIKSHFDKERITIGWTGTHSTAVYLDSILPALEALHRDSNIIFNVISNQRPDSDLDFVKFIQWQKDKEVDQLMSFDIGIMPLRDTSWEQGKCGFKIIQYLSLGIPAVASPVGVNREIIDHGKTGYLVTSEEEWITSLRSLILDKGKRNEFGRLGREKIVENYSVTANRDLFFSLFA